MNERIPVLPALERLKAPERQISAANEQGEARAEHREFDLESVELLMSEAAQRGYAHGVREAQSLADQQMDGLRKMVVDQTSGVFLDFLHGWLSDFETILAAPAMVPVEFDTERPPDEWVDDRAERLQALYEQMRRIVNRVAQRTGNAAYALDEDDPARLQLWTQVVEGAGEPVRDVPVVDS